MKNDKWFESWFSSPYYDLLYHKRDEQEAERFIDSLLLHLKPQPEAVFLDVACGKGRHAKYLASKGFEVTGIDLSPRKIEAAKGSETEKLQFFIHDMRNEFRINYYDYIFNFFTSFGYFESEHDNKRVVQNIFKGLKPNGIFVIDFLNAEKAIAEMKSNEIKVVDGISFEILRTLENGFITKKITIKDKEQTLHFSEKVKAITLDDFKKYFEKTGFTISDVFGDYPLHPFDKKNSPRLILIARKNHV